MELPLSAFWMMMSLPDDKSVNALSLSGVIFNSSLKLNFSNEEKHVFFISIFTLSRILSTESSFISLSRSLYGVT